MVFVIGSAIKRHKRKRPELFYTVGMDNGKQVIVEALKKHASEAMTKAKEFRVIAVSKATKEEKKESELYFQQAKEEEAKARGYLKQADILAETES